MNQLTTYRWSLEQDVRSYLSAGYEGIGLWRRKIEDYGEEQSIDLLAQSGLRVTNLLWAGGFTGGEAATFDDAMEDAAEAIRLAGALRAGRLLIHPGARNNHTFRHAERLFQMALSELLDLAEAADVTLLVEPMHPACQSPCTFLCDVESTVALIDSLDSPRLKLAFDTYHFGGDRAVLANLPELVPYLGVVHLGDRHVDHDVDEARCPLGEGVVPVAEIIRELLDEGYLGDFDVELIGSDVLPDDYVGLLESSRMEFEKAARRSAAAAPLTSDF